MENNDRRSFLRWIIHGLGAVFAVILGFPVICYLIDPRHRKAVAGGSPPFDQLRLERLWPGLISADRPSAGFRLVEGVRLDQLDTDKPVQGVIRAIRRDAWTLHPDDVLGRVWVTRFGDGPDDIRVFTTKCPHLGCFVNLNLRAGYRCPCHNAQFDLTGQRIGADSVAPRPMDELRWERDEKDPQLLRVEFHTFKQLAHTPIVVA